MKKNKKKETFVYRGLGLPIKLVNVPMRKVFGEWIIDVDMHKLQLAVLRALIYKQTPLTADEVKFIRKFFSMTTTDFGRIFGVSHVSVVKWENKQSHIAPSMELCIRLFVLEHLQAKDKEFRLLYKKINLEMLAKLKDRRMQRISIDLADDFKIAL